MTKADLVGVLHNDTGITRAQAEACLKSLADAIENNVLKGGDSLTIPGLGTFKKVEVAAKMGRNPATGAALRIPAKTKLVFKMSSTLK